MAEVQDVWLTTEQVGAILNIKPVTVRKWSNDGRFKGEVRMGINRLGYRVSALSLIAFLEAQEHAKKELEDLRALLREQAGV